jgi:hypothetical protein
MEEMSDNLLKVITKGENEEKTDQGQPKFKRLSSSDAVENNGNCNQVPSSVTFDEIVCKFRNKNTQSCNIEMKRLIRHISSKKILLQDVSFFDSLLGDREISAVVKLLKISPHIKTLDLSYNRFLIHGSRKIANCLSENGIANGKYCSLETLVLKGNQGIGPTGTAAFMSHVASNTCLTSLNIGTCQACQFGWSFGLKNLAVCLNENKTLKTLDFSNNRICINQFDHCLVFENVCKALKRSTIQNISFSQNNLNVRGGALIADAIANNESIVSINLSQCNIEYNAALALSAAIVQRQTSNYPIHAIDLTRNIFFTNNNVLKALSLAMFTEKNGISNLSLGGGNGRINNLDLNITGGNEYHGDDMNNLENQRFAGFTANNNNTVNNAIHRDNVVDWEGEEMEDGMANMIHRLSLINESNKYTKVLILQGIDFHNNPSFRMLCSLLKPVEDVDRYNGKTCLNRRRIQPHDTTKNSARRRLVPYHDWDKRTILQLEELHLDNTNLHENDFELLYDAIKIDPLTNSRNSNLKKVYIDRRDYHKNIKNDFIKEELLKPIVIGFIPVDKNIIYCVLNVLNRLISVSNNDIFALPLEIIIYIMKYLCSCEYRTVELVGDIIVEEGGGDNTERGTIENDDEQVNPFGGYMEGDGLFTSQRRQRST